MRLLPLLVLLLITACTGSGASQARPLDAKAQRQVRDLVTALTPVSATANSAVRGQWFTRRKALIEELNTAGEALGQAAFDELMAHPEAPLDVRRGLLEVAARNLPEALRPELVRLMTEYGEDIGLRTKACELLAQTSPVTALELLEPLITEHRPGRTLPPEEIMVTSYAIAADLAEIDPVPVLSAIAADLFAEQTARTMAVRKLGNYAGARSRETLRIVLVESTGNAYLRRAAAQTLVVQAKIDPKTDAELCSFLEEVMNKESDLNFQSFLVRMIERHCR
jgi:hypothetical protein